jgi:alpha-galactosidase
VVDKTRFPSGIKHLADYMHSKNMKFGIYSASTYQTCQFQPGGLGFEQIDADDYARWGVDFLKYDDCNGMAGYSYPEKYTRMGEALNKTGRPIFYSMTSGDNLIEMIGSRTIRNIANSWCNFETGDFMDNWTSFIEHLDVEPGQENFAGPYGWNNPDMLQVGNGGMTDDEYQTHFAMWALLKAPLVIGCDLRKMSNRTL